MSQKLGLANLLAALWTLHFKRTVRFWMEVVRRAAECALNDPVNTPITVSGYDGTIWLKSAEPEDAPSVDPSRDPPTPEQMAAARQWKAEQDRITKEIADGDRTPVTTGFCEVDLSALDSVEYFPVRMKFERAYGELCETGRWNVSSGESGDSSWESTARRVLQAIKVPGWTELHLRQYAERVARDDLEQSDSVSVEIARLDGEGFAERLLDDLAAQFPDDLNEVGIHWSAPSDTSAQEAGVYGRESRAENSENDRLLRDQDDGQADTSKKERKKRMLDKHARECIKRYKDYKRSGDPQSMKFVVHEYASENSDVSVAGTYRRLNDNSEHWS